MRTTVSMLLYADRLDETLSHYNRAIAESRARGGGALGDYSEDLLLDTTFRITDKNNGGRRGHNACRQHAVRGRRGVLPVRRVAVTVPRSGTSDTTVGSTCSIDTTIDGLLGSGAIVERKRAIWQLSPLTIYDGGADGVSSCADDNDIFAVPGLFFP